MSHSQAFDSFAISANAETKTKSFQEWAGGERVTLAIVFTNIVGSTALGEEIGDVPMKQVRRAHFAKSRKLMKKYNGNEIKTIGDSFMVAFRSVDIAFNYASELQRNKKSISIMNFL
jgi:class 3 adenylate cyclase